MDQRVTGIPHNLNTYSVLNMYSLVKFHQPVSWHLQETQPWLDASDSKEATVQQEKSHEKKWVQNLLFHTLL